MNKLEIVPSNFDFLSIESQHRVELIEDTEKLQQLDTTELLIRIAKGELLAKWRDRLDNGLWMAWTDSQFRYSHQTALNYIGLYENFGNVENNILENISGHYLLSSASDERKELVIDLASKGVKISKTLTYVFANSPAYILDLYLAEKLSPSQAKELTETYKKLYPETFELVAQYCEKWKIQTPAAIELMEWCVTNDGQRKSLAETNGKPLSSPTLLDELIKSDGALQAADFSAHISTADSATIDAFISERNRMLVAEAISKAWKTHRTSARVSSIKGGKLVLDIPNDLKLDIAKGTSVEIEIKVRNTSKPD